MLRIAICDDNNLICSSIEQMVLDYAKRLTVKIDVEVFTKGEDLLSYIKNEKAFDLIFLDIELGTTTGIKVGTTIREDFDDHISKIVFITSKQGYEKQLFDIQPLYFLPKPITANRIEKSIDLAIKLLDIDNKTFEYKKDYDIVKVNIKDILYFEKEGRKIKIITHTGADYFNDTLSGVKSRLPHTFLEPHGSFLVNFEKITQLTKDIIIMADKKEIPVSQRNLKTIREMIINGERAKKYAKLWNCLHSE